jgi:integrase
MASVRKRTWTPRAGGEAKSAWLADYFDQGGRRHIKTFRTRKAADAWLSNARHEISRGVHTAESASVTVAEAADLWIQRGEAERFERSTLDQYRSHAELHIKPRIGREKLARLTTPDVERFRDQLLTRLSWAMARKVLTSLKGILADAARRGLVAQNVALRVRIDARKRDRRRVAVGSDIPSKDEINAILDQATGRWRPLLVTAVFTGMRASELRGLTWDCVDLEARLIHVRQRADQWNVVGPPKSAAGHRSIPMAPIVLGALREWRLACPRARGTGDAPGPLQFVFPTSTGRPASHTNIIARGFNPIQIRAGVVKPDRRGRPTGKYGLHALRHFFASWAIEQGFSPKRVQVLLGHASIQMTFDVYGHLFPNPEDDHAKFAAGELALVR